MASKAEIANRVYMKLGERRTSNFDTDKRKSTLVIRDLWDSVLLSLLASFPWNFAVKRAQIAKDAAAPAWGYVNSYTVPTDFLALLEIKNTPDYRLEQNASGNLAILTDAGAPLYLIYISNITDTGLFSPTFVEAFAARLAVEACEPVTQSNTKKQILISEYDRIISVAYANDSIQDPPTDLPPSQWLLSRDSYTDDIDYNA